MPEEIDLHMTRPGLHLSLYMAKMLIELRNGGVVEDRSDEVEGDYGHRIALSFRGSNEDG